MTKSCLQCGETYTAGRAKQKFCGRACTNRARVTTPTKACEQCGVVFRKVSLNGKRTGNGALYCSQVCTSRAQVKSHAEEKLCEYCGELFFRRDNEQPSAFVIRKACSREHGHLLTGMKRLLHTPTPRTCEFCKETYEKPKAKGTRQWVKQRFCSSKCRNSARRKHKARQCAACGATYLPGDRKQYKGKTCSSECAGLQRKEGARVIDVFGVMLTVDEVSEIAGVSANGVHHRMYAGRDPLTGKKVAP